MALLIYQEWRGQAKLIYICVQKIGFILVLVQVSYQLLQFGRPSLVIDFFPHGMALPNTLHLAKRFSSIRNFGVLSLRELEEMDLETVFSADVFKKREIEALGTPPEDIKNATLDMLTIGPDNILDKNFDSSKFSDLCQDRGFKVPVLKKINCSLTSGYFIVTVIRFDGETFFPLR